MVKPTKAVKTPEFAKIGIMGPSGSGKTLTSLKMAAGLGKKICVIDTETGKSQQYADLFKFDIVEIDKESDDLDPAALADTIRELVELSYDVVIIDSLSHSWKAVLRLVDKASQQYKDNKFMAWRIGDARQAKLSNAILGVSAHMICTMRTKQKYQMVKNEETGKVEVQCLGLVPIQGKEIDYEFHTLFRMTRDNTLHVDKASGDADHKFVGRVYSEPDDEFIKDLRTYLGVK